MVYTSGAPSECCVACQDTGTPRRGKHRDEMPQAVPVRITTSQSPRPSLESGTECEARRVARNQSKTARRRRNKKSVGTLENTARLVVGPARGVRSAVTSTPRLTVTFFIATSAVRPSLLFASSLARRGLDGGGQSEKALAFELNAERPLLTFALWIVCSDGTACKNVKIVSTVYIHFHTVPVVDSKSSVHRTLDTRLRFCLIFHPFLIFKVLYYSFLKVYTCV